MATSHGRLTTVLANEFDLSSRVTKAAMSRDKQAVSVTGMGVDDEEFISGLMGASLTLGGPWDDAAGQNEVFFNAQLGTTTVFTVGIDGADASGDFGNRCFMIETLTNDYAPRVAHNDAVRFSAGGPAASAARSGGRLLHPTVAETGTADFASSDMLASSAFGGQAHLHVLAYSGGGSVTIKVQDSADDSAWADLITFGSVTAVGTERATVAGTVDQFLRGSISAFSATSVTFAISFAKNRS